MCSATGDTAWKIVLSDLDYGIEEEAAVLRVLRSKWLSMGAETVAFEEEFAAVLQCKHALAVSNGTAALHLAFLALGLGPGDEIIQPAVNFVATANMTVQVGARPVFADIVSLENPTLDPHELERLTTPRTRAVVVMHYGGCACDMSAVLEFCCPRGIAVIEDACHGVGGAYQGRAMGTLGDISAFSFFSNKNLAVGEGGMVATDRDYLAASVRLLRSHGMTTMSWERHRGHSYSYDVTRHGLNYRIDELRSALGRAQLAKLAGNNTRRRRLARHYLQQLQSRAAHLAQQGWIFPPLGANTEEASHHLFVAVAPDENTREDAAARLKQAGIQTSRHYPYIPAFSAFAQEHAVNLPKSEAFCRRVLTLPLHPKMTPQDVELVVSSM